MIKKELTKGLLDIPTDENYSSRVLSTAPSSPVNLSFAESNVPEYKVSSYRWVILAVFSGIAFNSFLMVASINPLLELITIGFPVKQFWVILMMTMPHILYAPMSVVASKMFQKLPAKNVFRSAVLIMLLGSWIRILAFTQVKMFWVLFMGHTIFNLATPLILNGTSIVAIAWFPEHQKSTVTATIFFGAQCGSVAGLVTSGVSAIGLDKTNAKDDFTTVKNTIFITNTISSIICILFLILFRGKPDQPPSRFAEETMNRNDQKTKNWSSIISQLIHNKNYICNATIYIIISGLACLLAACVTPLLSVGGYSTSEIALVGVCTITGGLGVLILAGIILDKTKEYLFAARLVTSMLFLCSISAVWVIPAGNLVLTCTLMAVIGAFMIPVVAICLPITIMVSHPIPSDVSNGIMMTLQQLFAAFGTFIGASIISQNWSLGMVIIIMLSFIPVIAAQLMTNPVPAEDNYPLTNIEIIEDFLSEHVTDEELETFEK